MGTFYANLILDASLITFPLLYLKFVEKKKGLLDELGLGKTNGGWRENVLLSVKILLCLIAASFALTLVLRVVGLDDLQMVEGVIRGLVSSPLLLLLYYMLIRVFAEELFFRAFLVPRFGVAVSSILFGLSHLTYGSVGEVAGAIVLGGILAYFYGKERKLAPNYVAHLLYNTITFVVTLSP